MYLCVFLGYGRIIGVYREAHLLGEIGVQVNRHTPFFYLHAHDFIFETWGLGLAKKKWADGRVRGRQREEVEIHNVDTNP